MSGIESRLDENLVARYLLNDNCSDGTTLISNIFNRYEDLSEQENNIIFSNDDNYQLDTSGSVNIGKISGIDTSYSGIGDFGNLDDMLSFTDANGDGNFLLSGEMVTDTTSTDSSINFLTDGTLDHSMLRPNRPSYNRDLNTNFYNYINGEFSIAYWTQLQVSGKKTSTNNENDPLNYTFSMTKETSAYTNFYNNKFSLGVGITEQLIPIEFMIKGNCYNQMMK